MPNAPNAPDRRSQTAATPLVRESSPADSAAIRRILGGAGLSPLPAVDPRTPDSTQTAAYEVLVCEFGGEVVAVLQWRQVSQEVEIFDVAVDTACRRKGIASLLLQSVLAVGKKRGATEYFLEVRESNAAALALYRKFGFDLTGRRPRYYRDSNEAALLLKLQVLG